MVKTDNESLQTYTYIQRDTGWEFKWQKFTKDNRQFDLIKLERLNFTIPMTICISLSRFRSQIIMKGQPWSVKQ